MKNIAIAAGLILLTTSTTLAKSPPEPNTVEQLAIEIADAYVRKNLGRLDRKYPIQGRVKIEIEDSLGGEGNVKDKSKPREFQSLAQGEQWLRSRANEFPVRQSKPLIGCKQGSCTYDFSAGILHNQLYLKKISYGYKNGRLYLKTIYLLDGN